MDRPQIAHHELILHALHALNADYFSKISALFGGGTLLALTSNEYRRSDDIDFLISDRDGYKQLRSDLFGTDGSFLLKENSGARLHNLRADQYGVRGALIVDNTPIKLEIVSDNRLEMSGGFEDGVSHKGIPVKCLSTKDCLTQKLFANADRGMDVHFSFRDLIDLAVLANKTSAVEFEQAIERAATAYPVKEPLIANLTRFTGDAELREESFRKLEIASEFIPQILEGVDKLNALIQPSQDLQPLCDANSVNRYKDRLPGDGPCEGESHRKGPQPR